MRRPPRNFRVLWLAGLLVLVGYGLASTGLAQTAGAAPAAADKPVGEGVVGIVLHNVDFVFVVIATLSVVALSLMISSAIRLRQAAFVPPVAVAQMRSMIEQGQLKDLYAYTEADSSFVGEALNAALKRAPNFDAMKEAMETSVGEQTAEQFRKIEYLNIIGNLGPLLGLLGTVLGMIKAFSDMQAAQGSADPSVLAGGISKALAHTFLGLFLAVPALAAFGVLRTMVDRLTIRGALVAEELLLMIRPAETPKPAAPAGPRSASGVVSGSTRPRVNPIPQPPTAPVS